MSSTNAKRSKKTVADNCDFDPKSKSLETAQLDIQSVVEPVVETESLLLSQAAGRVLATDVVAQQPVPPHANSAMDGYALRMTDLPAHRTLPVAGTNLAGQPAFTELPTGACLRIMTGAVLPAGADAVVMQEQVECVGDDVLFPESMKPGQNIRPAGDDIAANQNVLIKGRTLSAPELGVLASLGYERISVVRRLRVAVFVTGDELQSPGQALAAGQIYDSNRITLLALLERSGCEAVDLGRAPDSLEGLTALLSEVSLDSSIDAVITTGGVSVGEADFVRDAVAAVGKLQLWRVAIKPGRPFAYGRLGGGQHFFGLPGNPVSAMVTFLLLVMPALRKMQGAAVEMPTLLPAIAQTRLRKRPGRADYQRGSYQSVITDAGIELQVSGIGDQGSGRLSSLTAANCLIALGADDSDREVGESVGILPFSLLF